MFGLIYAVLLFGIFLIGLLADLFAGRATRHALLTEAKETREARNVLAAKRAAAQAASYAGHASRATASSLVPLARDWAIIAKCWATVACGVATAKPVQRRWARHAARRARMAYEKAKRGAR